MPAPHLPPDVLVLGAGGPAEEAWMTGLLRGLEDAAGVRFAGGEALVGTGAGAVVAARLASGQSPAEPDALVVTTPAPPGGRPAELPLAWLASAPLVPYARALRAPLAARLRAAALARLPGGERGTLDGVRQALTGVERRFDGRLRVVCVERSSGRRVVFGAPGRRRASVVDAVTASVALPWAFPPVPVAGRDHVAGAVWSPTNVDAAPALRDTQVLVVDPAASLGVVLASPRHAGLAAVRAVTEAEALTLRRRGARVRTVGPDRAAAELLARGADPVAVAHAGRRQGVRAARP